MSTFEIIHRIDGHRLIAVVLNADNEESAQEAFIDHCEKAGWVHGEIVNIEEV